MTGLSLQLNCPGEGAFRLTVDCHIPDRGITAIYGHSGGGKTTLLNCIAGLRAAAPGSLIQFRNVVWQSDQQFVPPWQRSIGFVFQDARLFPHLNVLQNLEYSSQFSRHQGDISISSVVELLHLGDLLERPADSLSAGQKQRVAIGRALLSAPQLLLLDEPLANLDHAARGQCLYYLRRLRSSLDLPMLYVSHDIEETSQLADHLVLLEDGKIEAQGSMLELCSSLDTRLSQDEQSAAIVLGTIKRHDNAYNLTELEVEGETFYVNHLPEPLAAKRRLRIPARDVSVCRRRPPDSSILNIVPVELAEIGDVRDARVLLRLTLGEQHLLARITHKSLCEMQLVVGDLLFAQIKSAALLTEAVGGHI
ncbi:MAG: molybdenum ABC transporter ATP-binding protein [Halieaceae bacterium]|jgi:molybdate transport system ATP-binding protein|nr:molybdenum ABC transporter ATP-binding protein [Halieaceae bacterium]